MAERDGSGRFRRGNSGGPGNPHVRRLGAFQTAVREAVEPADLADAMRSLASITRGEMQDGGTYPSPADRIAAARVLVERCAGKAEAPPRFVPDAIDLGPMESAADALKAARRIVVAMASGALDLDSGRVLLDGLRIVDQRQLADMEERLDALEGTERRDRA